LCGAGTDVFAVLFYVIANAYKDTIELNPKLVANILGCTPERVQDAIDRLCLPKPQGGSAKTDSSILERVGQWQYRICTGAL